MLKEYNPQRKDITDGDDVDSEKILLDERSIFVVVADSNGKEKVVRKSAVCYVLSKDKHKLSSDRLRRVQEKEYGNITGSSKHFYENHKSINPAYTGIVLRFHLVFHYFCSRQYRMY